MNDTTLELTSSAESRRILLVDDNPTNLDVLLKTLDGHGHDLLVAQSGEEAVRLARETRPALILLDIMMPPGIDGFETCKRLKSDPATRDAVVIFLSAKDEVADKVEGLSLGAADFISKPFQIDEVLARVESQLDAHDRIREMQEKVEQLNEQLDARNEEDDDVPWAERIRALIASGETETCEFKSTIRRNLKSGKNDKAIEKAWLKTIVAFLNSEGGTLLVGVDDAGQILGLEADEFNNDDHAQLHVNNLIKNHIGPEYAQFIHIGICVLDEKSVLAFTCSHSGPPAFLKIEDGEDVYIRIGPGSRKLTTREAMEYFEARDRQ